MPAINKAIPGIVKAPTLASVVHFIIYLHRRYVNRFCFAINKLLYLFICRIRLRVYCQKSLQNALIK